ncbi:MAG: glycosyltransferase family protein [Candidatus Margulisiibacteriota bacterium]
MKIVAIIQARMGSTRLPGKALIKIADKTVLEHVIRRVQACRLVNEVVVATTVSKGDLPIIKLCAEQGISVYCGSEDDVLDRYYQAAKLFKAKTVIRITADCPLMDPQVIETVLRKHIKDRADYTSNTINETFPDGEDVEVFSAAALEKAWIEAKLSSEREHVTAYIRKNPAFFKLAGVEYKTNLKEKRWTLDNQEDLEFVGKIYSALYQKNNLFSMDDILEYLAKYPELEQINSHITRNEGYQKSLREDKIVKERK